MKMIVGLGNPGRKYKGSRHNLGFMVIDDLCNLLKVSLDQKKFKAEYGIFRVDEKKVMIVKPLTFMNLCGEAVAPLLGYYKLNLEDLVVIYDDLDLPCGRLRLRKEGGDGGHNGIKSLISHLGTKEFKRIRIGIDKDPLMVTADYVLGKPSLTQRKLLKPIISTAVTAAKDYVNHDFDWLMNKYNHHE